MKWGHSIARSSPATRPRRGSCSSVLRSRRAAALLLVTRALGIYSAQRRAQVLSTGRKTPFLMVGTEMQAPASLGTTVVPFFANTAKTQNLT